MKKKLKNRLTLGLMGLASLFILGGCTGSESLEDVLKQHGLGAQITYYANGGQFESKDDEKNIYYKVGSQPLNIGVVKPVGGSVEITRLNYDFDGWYFAKCDSQGNPIYTEETVEENGTIVKIKTYELGDPVDFSRRLQENEHWHIVAKWVATVRVDVKIVVFNENGEIDANAEVVDATTQAVYKTGSVVDGFTYGTAGNASIDDTFDTFEVKDDAYTFVSYYNEEACTTRVTEDRVKAEGQTENDVVYAKYIKGDWNVVRSGSEATDIFKTYEEKFWLYKDIDAVGNTVIAKRKDGTFENEVQGNGYRISNLSVQASKIAQNQTVSLFGNILETAVIENVTFENVKVEYDTFQDLVTTYFVFTSVAADATVSNVTISGKMTVDIPGSKTVTAELYGGDTDGGFTIEGTKETIIEII